MIEKFGYEVELRISINIDTLIFWGRSNLRLEDLGYREKL